MKYFNFLFLSLLFLLGLTFGIQNAPLLGYAIAFQFRLWFFSLESLPMPLGAAMALAFFAGIFFSIVWFLVHELKLRRELFQRNQKIKQQQLEIQNLRRTLITDPSVETLSAASPTSSSLPQMTL